ncbi:hypothetical protein [Algoriphagus machipongonensis]|uniref:Uncharacterized protein n=1 Tax=Algoriphagus machipongonensis TaxID=388413 RepID=A3HSN6_9BACT|nr:hypothetical protein [Algoriphagus machipongonensis]EAZ82854.1 hypothetical protein ALPR1_11575 [Algoriphagus machipongonensis]
MLSEELKILLRRFFPILAFFILAPLLSYGIWWVYPEKELKVLIMDKTVLGPDLVEHSSIFWVLNHLKIVKEDQSFYHRESDYLGYYPAESTAEAKIKDLSSFSQEDIKKQVEGLDLVYYTDTYGVMATLNENSATELIPNKIYGGLDQNDLALIREVKEQEKTLVAEFNTMASPTSKSVRTEFENLMGLQWTGWIGRYFDDFDTLSNQGIPTWVRTQYKKQHEGEWLPNGPGLLFIHEDGKIEGLSFESDYLNKIPLIRTQRINPIGENLPEIVPYPDWFDVVLIERNYNVISYYDISPTPEGLEKLREMGLPRFFPAAVVKDNGKGKMYYLSGDFSDLRTNLGSHKFTGLPFFWKGLHLASDHTDRESFFWNYYYPLTSKILQISSKSTD